MTPYYAVRYWEKTGSIVSVFVSINPFDPAAVNAVQPWMDGMGKLVLDMVDTPDGWRIHDYQEIRQIIADKLGLPVRSRDDDIAVQVHPETKRVVGRIYADLTSHDYQDGLHVHIQHKAAVHDDRWDGQRFYRTWAKVDRKTGEVVELREVDIDHPDHQEMISDRDDHLTDRRFRWHESAHEISIGDVLPLTKEQTVALED